MGRKQPSPGHPEDLRKRAEVSLGKVISKTVPSLATENVEALVHELHVHQIELEMQCEELRRTRHEAEESRDRYYDLYESAPAPYVTVDGQLRVTEINGAGERLLGLDRQVVVGHRLSEFVTERDVLPVTQSCRHVFKSSGVIAREVELHSREGTKTVLMDASLVEGLEDERHLRLAMTVLLRANSPKTD